MRKPRGTMAVYHGTSMKRARKICLNGFVPRKPSKRVWFAMSRKYAQGRARTQARRTHDKPCVLCCSIDLNALRRRLGRNRVFCAGGIIAVDGTVPVSVLRTFPTAVGQPTSPEDLARWVNSILRLKPHKGVSPRDEGVGRLSRWVMNRLSVVPSRRIKPTELLAMARRWLPKLFQDYVVDPERLHAYRKVVPEITLSTREAEAEVAATEDATLELLADPDPRARMRGLAALAKEQEEDLFDWCLIAAADASPDVQLLALHTMLHCAEGDPESVLPLAKARDKRVRAAAIAVLARFGGPTAPLWYEYGLTDPEACVRAETAVQLGHLDPAGNRRIFELALHDPNEEISRRARRVAAGHTWAHAEQG